MIPVEAADDPRLEPYRFLRERDLAGRRGTFIAEGEVVLRVLLSGRSRFAPDSLLLSETRARRLEPVLATVAVGVPIYVAQDAVLEAVAGFPVHRGVLALGRRGGTPTAPTLLSALSGGVGLASPRPALALGLLGLANHDNVGGAFRNAAAFGADAVLLDGRSCDPLYRKAIRVSVGAALVVPFARGGTPVEVADALAAAGFVVLALSPGGDEPLEAVRWPHRAALLVGSEGEGLPASLLRRLRTVRIPMAPGFDSLNVATASGIALAAAFASRTLGDGPA